VHQRLETHTADTQDHVHQKPAKYVHELKQHLIETWSASLIKQLIHDKQGWHENINDTKWAKNGLFFEIR